MCSSGSPLYSITSMVKNIKINHWITPPPWVFKCLNLSFPSFKKWSHSILLNKFIKTTLSSTLTAINLNSQHYNTQQLILPCFPLTQSKSSSSLGIPVMRDEPDGRRCSGLMHYSRGLSSPLPRLHHESSSLTVFINASSLIQPSATLLFSLHLSWPRSAL